MGLSYPGRLVKETLERIERELAGGISLWRGKVNVFVGLNALSKETDT